MKIKIPHTFLIVFSIIILSSILTWIIPSGEFVRETKILTDGRTTEIIKKDSFHYVENNKQTWQAFAAFYKGFIDKANIIIFILIIGGAFWIMNETKAIDVGIKSFLQFTQKIEKFSFFKKIGVDNIIFLLIMTIFSIFGSVFGMSEETIAFVIIFVPLSIKLGYDSIVGVSLCFIAATLGFASALLNPFTLGIAQGLAGIKIFSGIEYRLICGIIINIIGFTFILIYANKIKKNPQKSIMYELDNVWRQNIDSKKEPINLQTPPAAWIIYIITGIILSIFAYYTPSANISIGNFHILPFPIFIILLPLYFIFGFICLRKSYHYFILNILIFTIIYLIIGVMGFGWYMLEIATLFLAMGLIAGISAGYNANKICKLFIEGAKDITSAALIVGLAAGIIIILQDGKIIDTILFYVSKSMVGIGKIGAISIMYIIQNIINIIIPSGSAKAALTMPIMAPFSDIIGISRQATVTAFLFGDGFTNMITPTSGVLIGVLGVAKIPYEKWVKWIFPLILILIIIGWILLIPTVSFKLPGY